ncbi:unnamed protein product [Amoebophrya sp. A120]|nr:unnamed protein product [Amoebophrya sp. A120]|eukprot:GSA120T00015991001.1
MTLRERVMYVVRKVFFFCQAKKQLLMHVLVLVLGLCYGENGTHPLCLLMRSGGSLRNISCLTAHRSLCLNQCNFSQIDVITTSPTPTCLQLININLEKFSIHSQRSSSVSSTFFFCFLGLHIKRRAHRRVASIFALRVK